MKVFVMLNNYGDSGPSDHIGWYLLSDSAVTNTGKPFYLPDEYGNAEVSLSIAVRISRLGKCVAPKFAERYFSEYAPVLHFTLPDYAKTLASEGLPTDAARSFDRSLFVGDFRPWNPEESVRLLINKEFEASFSIKNLTHSVENLISDVSRLNTIKMGDLLLPGLSGKIMLKQEDILEVMVEDSHAFYVKVK